MINNNYNILPNTNKLKLAKCLLDRINEKAVLNAYQN